MNMWHEFLKTHYKNKRITYPNYSYKQAMKDAKIPYSNFKIELKKMRKEIGKKIHIIRDPLNYIMPEYLNTYDKITLKLSHDFFLNVRLNKKDLKLLYLENRKKMKKDKSDMKLAKSIIALGKHFPIGRVKRVKRLTKARLKILLCGVNNRRH